MSSSKLSTYLVVTEGASKLSHQAPKARNVKANAPGEQKLNFEALKARLSAEDHGFAQKVNKRKGVAASEPGAVATGQRFTFQNKDLQNAGESIWPVATARGSDVEHFLCKAENHHVAPSALGRLQTHDLGRWSRLSHFAPLALKSRTIQAASTSPIDRIPKLRLTFVVTLMLSLVLLIPSTSSAIAKTDKRKSRTVNRAASRALTRAEIKAAESRLAELGYETGPVDGVIDSLTRNALIVFQKWEGQNVTGRLSREDFDLIMNASAPTAKDAGYRHVEVDLDRQVLLLTDDSGAVIKILPVSTGSNRQYREKTMSGLAYTPRGRFRIESKIAGWRKSPLGLLYYPNYFSGGLAIHGNPSVPQTPESHGCIRIPMSAAVEMSRLLPLGTIVIIYDRRSFVSAKDWAKQDMQAQTR